MKNNVFTKYRLLISLLVALLLGGANYMFFNYQKSVFSRQIKVIVFNQDVGPDTLITDEMIDYKLVYLSSFDPNYYLQHRNDVIGTYIKPNVTVFRHQLINKNSVTKNNQANFEERLEEGHITFTIKLNELTSYGDAFEVDQEINLYFKGLVNQENDAVIHGLLVEEVKIIAVLDNDGNKSKTNEKMFLVLSLSESEYHLVQVAKVIGEITPVIQNQPTDYFDQDSLIGFVLSHTISFIKEVPVIEVEVDG